MKLNPIYRGIMYCALALPATALAQQSQAIEEIVVTGSLIRGIPADAAMPVDTISADDLERRGSPPPLEMLKNLSYMNGIVGESNNFTSGRGQAAHGTASVNLRGLGEARTLVLLNGKRLTAEDINRLPQNAIARVEVLKDGGAVTYGSDAIAGVVNYITKEGQDGFEFNADYRAIEDSDGDYNIGLTWGTSTDNSDFFVSFNYYHRSELQLEDVDYTLQPYSRNPQGGWASGANPGNFLFLNADPACEAFGGVRTQGGSNNPQDYWEDPAGAQCRTRYTEWYNLVEDQDSYQFFTSYKLNLNDNTQLTLEALYAESEVEHATSAPSYTTANFVPRAYNPRGSLFYDNIVAPGNTSPVIPFYYVPANNPGLVSYLASNPTAAAVLAGTDAALSGLLGGGTFIQLNQWRPFFAGGNPAFGYKGAWTNYEREQYRLSAELTGNLTNSIGYRTSLSYTKSEDMRQEWDVRIDKLQRALSGYAGDDCDLDGPAGAGNCMWLNPFSNAIPNIPGVGPNPYFDASTDLAEQAAVAAWLMERHTAVDEDELIEFNFILDGELNVDLGGGNIGWAAGVQYREETTGISYWDGSNQNLQPCPEWNDRSCVGTNLQGASPWTFLATYMPYKLDREVKAVFGEMIIPVTDNFTAQIAARYEDYGSDGGDSFDPNLRIRWQLTDWMALRGSAGTTFRAPAQASLQPTTATAFQAVRGNSTPIRTRGNPGLEPEEATNFNLGLMFTGDNYSFTIDYWNIEIDKRLAADPLTGMVEQIYKGTSASLSAAENAAIVAANCAAIAAASSTFLDRFDFGGGPGACGTTITGVRLNTINAGKIENDGIDLQGHYTWDNIGPGSLTLGGSATWINKFETEGIMVEGIQVEASFDGVGKLNSGTTLFPLPEWRGNVFLDYAMDRHNIRWTINYVDSYEDNRDIFDERYTSGQTIGSHTTHNITYRLDLNDNVTISAVLDNVFDREPPFARLEMNYDPVTHSPLLRTFKLGARIRF